MDAKERDILRRHSPVLVNTIDPVLILPYLPCLQEHHKEQITNCKVSVQGHNSMAVQKLISCLHTKKTGFKELIQALRDPDIGLSDLADKLDPNTDLSEQQDTSKYTPPFTRESTRRLSKQPSKRRPPVTMETRFKDLPQSAISIIADVDSSEFNNAEELAGVIDLTFAQFEKLKAHCEKKESLTISILKFWDEQNEICLQNILDYLREMKRNDVIQKLKDKLKIKFEPTKENNNNDDEDENNDDNSGDDGNKKNDLKHPSSISVDRLPNPQIPQDRPVSLDAKQNIPQYYNKSHQYNQRVDHQLSPMVSNGPAIYYPPQQYGMVGHSVITPYGTNGQDFNVDPMGRADHPNGGSVPGLSDFNGESELHHNTKEGGFNSEHTYCNPDDNLKKKFTGYRPEDILPNADIEQESDANIEKFAKANLENLPKTDIEKLSVYVVEKDSSMSTQGKFRGYNQVELLGINTDGNINNMEVPSSTTMNNQKKFHEMCFKYDKDLNIHVNEDGSERTMKPLNPRPEFTDGSEKDMKPLDPRPEFTDNVDDMGCSPLPTGNRDNINVLPSSVDSNSSNETNSDNNADFGAINDTKVETDVGMVDQTKCDNLVMPIMEQTPHDASNEEKIPCSTQSEIYRQNIGGDEHRMRMLEHNLMHDNLDAAMMDETSLQSSSRVNSCVVKSFGSSFRGYVSEVDEIDRPKLSIQSELNSIKRKAGKFLPGPAMSRDMKFESLNYDTDHLYTHIDDDNDLFADGDCNNDDDFTASVDDKRSQSNTNDCTNQNQNISLEAPLQNVSSTNTVISSHTNQSNSVGDINRNICDDVTLPMLPSHSNMVVLSNRTRPYQVALPPNLSDLRDPLNYNITGQPSSNTNVGQPSNDTNEGQPSNNTNEGQPSNDTNEGQPSNDTNVGQPSNDTNEGQPSNDTNVGQSSNNTNVGQPSNNTNVGQPSNDSNVGHPYNNANVGQLSNDTNLGQPSYDTNLGQPSNNTDVGQPSNNANVGQPSNYANVGQPSNNTTMGQLSNNANAGHPLNNTVMGQASNDDRVNLADEMNPNNMVQTYSSSRQFFNNSLRMMFFVAKTTYENTL